MLPSIASGEAMISYALSEREAGSDAAAMRTRAVADGDDWVLNGTKCWITNAGVSSWYTVMAVTDPDKRSKGISAFVVHADDPGFVVGTKERKLGIKGSPTREIHFENCRIPGNRIIGAPGTGFSTAMATLDHTRPTIGAQAIGIAQGALDVAVGIRQGAQAVRQEAGRVPGPAVHDRRHGHGDRRRPGPWSTRRRRRPSGATRTRPSCPRRPSAWPPTSR